MKLLIKLAIFAALVHAGFRLGTEYLVHYQFRDAVREAAMFRARTAEELGQHVMEVATAHGVPLDPDGFTLKRDTREAIVEGSYVKAIEFVPGFPYDWRFDFAVQAYVNNVAPLPGAPPKAVSR
jgi:hypothetical protein